MQGTLFYFCWKCGRKCVDLTSVICIDFLGFLWFFFAIEHRVVQVLLKKGAVWKDHTDKFGNNALQLAQEHGHTQVEFLLEGKTRTGEVKEIEREDEDDKEQVPKKVEL